LEGKTEVKRAKAGFVISLVAGILIVICSVFFLVAAVWMHEWIEGLIGSRLGNIPVEVHLTGAGQLMLAILGVVGLIFGIIVLVGAYFIYTPGERDSWWNIGASIFYFKHICWRGFFVGLILGIVGGALGLAKK